MTQDLMVDIETMGNGPNAAIIQIGACYFNRLYGYDCQEHPTFAANISLDDAMRSGFEVNSGTIKWWMDQVQAGNPTTWRDVPQSKISVALQEFRHFAANACRIWSHTSFDFVIIQNALTKLGIHPLPYRTARDIRTLVDLSGVKPNTRNKPHDALKDALYQVEYCVKCFERIKPKEVTA